MTELLRTLRDGGAFNPFPGVQRLREMHVRFDELAGVGGVGVAYERKLEDALLRGERVTLVGASGSGKTSITEFVLGGAQKDGVLAPIRVRFGMQTADQLVQNPAKFPELIVDTVARELRNRKARKAKREIVGSAAERSVRVKAGMGLPWLAEGNLEVELGSVTEQGPLHGGMCSIVLFRSSMSLLARGGCRFWFSMTPISGFGARSSTTRSRALHRSSGPH